jgi:hypothetical protein
MWLKGNGEKKMLKEATVSEDQKFRYFLKREWDTYRRASVLFVMLNPSTADATNDDPTIRKCIGFAKRWGFGSITVANLYAFRATSPIDLKKSGYAIGPENDWYLRWAADDAAMIVAAWGVHAQKERADAVTKKLCERKNVFCLGVTKDRFPRHPLMVPYSQERMMFDGSISRHK